MVNAEDVNMADLGDRARSSGARWRNVSHQPLASVIKIVIKMYSTLLLNGTNAPFKGNNWYSISRGREELGRQEPIWESHDHGNIFSKDFHAFSLHPFLLSLPAQGTSVVCLGILSHAGVLPGIPSCWDGLLVYPFSIFLLKSPHFGIWETCGSKHGLWSHAYLAWMHDFTCSVLVFLVCEMGWIAILWRGANEITVVEQPGRGLHRVGPALLVPEPQACGSLSVLTLLWILIYLCLQGLVIARRK